MERNQEMLLLQLRASQAENLRLRNELQGAIEILEKKESSRFATPEDKVSTEANASKEDGAVAQQDLRRKVLKAQEELVSQEAFLRSLTEDGPAGQQEHQTSVLGLQEDGPGGQQEFDLFGPSSSQEDGQECQQVEDGQECQQDQSRPAGRSSRRPSRQIPVENETLSVMLQLMKGMQSMQERLLDRDQGAGRRQDNHEEEEMVRSQTDLHVLPEWTSENAPVDFSDWLLLVSAQMADLSTSSATWWDLTVSEARDWYKKHQFLKPLEKLKHLARPSAELLAPRWNRLEKRASTMLLRSIPDAQRGGGQEKQAVLLAIESPAEASSISEGTHGLRKWLRWKRRAEEVGVTLPDASVLLRGLDRLMGKVLQSNAALNFRIQLARTTLMIDAIPTLSSVEQYAECLLAELDQFSYSARKKVQSGTGQGQPAPARVRKLEEGGKLEEKRGKGKPNEACRFYLTPQGCRRAKECPLGHVLDGEKRCWACGSKEHFASQCPRCEETKPKAAKASTKSPEKEKTQASSSKEDKKNEDKEKADCPPEDTMKSLLDEATKMLKTMEGNEAVEKRAKAPRSEDKMELLQKQLEGLKASLKPFRLSKICEVLAKGLLDSGATHPLRARRPGEVVDHFCHL